MHRSIAALLFIAGLIWTSGVAQPFEVHDRRLLNVSDLTAAGLGFDGRTSAVSFDLVNRGGVAISTPFKIDVQRDALRVTLDFAAPKVMTDMRSNRVVPIQPYERRRIVVHELKVDPCSGNHTVKVTIDSGQAVAEADETNNVAERVAAAPCPDLTVVSIGKNYNRLRTEYVAEVTIANQGTGSAGRFNVFAVTSSQVTGLVTLPDNPYRVYDSLAPGETIKFTVGDALAIEKMWVRVVVDMPNWNKESNEDNNEMRKTLN